MAEMSMLLGNKNAYGSIYTRAKPGAGVPLKATPVYICRTCMCEFYTYAGMVRVGSGIGYCPDHDPEKETKDGKSA